MSESAKSTPLYDLCVVGAGYAGVDNPLFFEENNKMLLGDAKDSMSQLMARLA